MTDITKLPVIGSLPTTRGVLFQAQRVTAVEGIRVVNVGTDTASVWMVVRMNMPGHEFVPIWPNPVRLEAGCMAEDDKVMWLPVGWHIEGWTDRPVTFAIFGTPCSS